MDFHKLGYDAIVNDKSLDFEAFKKALSKANNVPETPSYAILKVYQGALAAAALEKDEQRARSIIPVIMNNKNRQNLPNEHRGPTKHANYGIEQALLRHNFLVATLLIEYIDDLELNDIGDALYYTIVAAANASKTSDKTGKITEDVTKGLRSIFQTLINKLNRPVRKDSNLWRTEKLLRLTNDVVTCMKMARDRGKDTAALQEILYVLLQYVILPAPPTEGDDFYEEARELWEKMRFEKVKALKQGTPSGFDGRIIDNIKTFGLQRFCTKCHGEVL